MLACICLSVNLSVSSRYIDTVGAQTIADKMQALEQEHGAQFAPPQMLLDYAKASKKFHA